MARAATLPPVDPVVPPGRCRLLGCATPSNVRGLCLPHYDLARRKGQLDELALPPIPRGRGTRFQRPAESAPSTRPQRAPRTRRAAAPRHEGEALRAIWVALGSPELAQSESPELEILRAAEQRLRLDAQLSSRILGLEEDGVRLREQLQAARARVEELEGEATAAQLARTRAFEERAELICSLLEALGGPPLAPGRTTWRQEDLVGEVRRLRASADHVLDAIRVLSAAVLDPAQEWGGQLCTDDHATLGQAVAVAVATLESAKAKILAVRLETPESLERRYQALRAARRLRDLLEGRSEPRVQLPEGTFTLQEIWIWDLLGPILPGEIERLEREAGVSHG